MTERRRPDLENPGYEDLFRRASERVRGRLPEILQEIDAAAATVQDLQEISGPERRELVRSEKVSLRGLALCNVLEEKSREAWFTDPDWAVELADLAVEVANRLDISHYGEALVEDAKALAWAYLGNALQIAADLRGAEEALRRAEEHHQRGDQDELTAAQILSFQASLRNAQGRFEEAARLLDRAINIYHEANDRHLEGRTLIQKATALVLLCQTDCGVAMPVVARRKASQSRPRSSRFCEAHRISAYGSLVRLPAGTKQS